jgi:hypothetical protein
MIISGNNGTLVTLDIDTVTLEDVQNDRLPNLTPVQVTKPKAAKLMQNYAGYFVQTEDGKIHAVSHGQFISLGLVDLNLPVIEFLNNEQS